MFWGNMAWHGLVRLAWSWACPLAWPGQADEQTPTLEKVRVFGTAWSGFVAVPAQNFSRERPLREKL